MPLRKAASRPEGCFRSHAAKINRSMATSLQERNQNARGSRPSSLALPKYVAQNAFVRALRNGLAAKLRKLAQQLLLGFGDLVRNFDRGLYNQVPSLSAVQRR